MDKNAHFMETISNIRELPNLSSDTIHIWGVHVPYLLDLQEQLHTLLSDKERTKAARFRREADRQSSIAARGALRILLGGYAEVPAAEIQFQYSEYGKPHVAGSSIDFNVSHSGEWVVLAFGRNRNIGVDVEQIKRDMDVVVVADRFFAAEEVAQINDAADPHITFFQLWARKEAYVKACGSTLFRELNHDMNLIDDWVYRRLEAGSKYAAAVVTDQPLVSVPCYDFGGLKWDS